MKILLVGTGYMAREYAKVLKALNVEFDISGRGIKNCNEFNQIFKKEPIAGGLNYFPFKDHYSHCIIASSIDSLFENAGIIIGKGISRILLEKPGGINVSEIKLLAEKASSNHAIVVVAYNRRFYSSVINAQKMIEEDGGVKSFNFEFTEWSHSIEPLEINTAIKQNWFLANSTHVVDTAFFLGGFPYEWSYYHMGSLSWHLASSKFSGAGISVKDATFSYQANWEAPGRWSVEMLTNKRRLVLRPMEKLQVQKIGSVNLETAEVDDRLDLEYKPGLYLQTQAFLNNDLNRFCTIEEQAKNAEDYFIKISGY